jgi:hypothetical protein
VGDKVDTLVEAEDPVREIYQGKERTPCHLSGGYLLDFRCPYPGFSNRAFQIGFVVIEVTLEKVFSDYLGSSPLSNIPPGLILIFHLSASDAT